MKICYLSNTAVPSKSAASIQIIKMCENFSKLNNKVLGWIIIAYICIGFYYVGSGSNYDECSPINMRGFQECISYPE